MSTSVTVQAQLKPRSQFGVVGKPQRRIDALDIVTGRKKFALDTADPHSGARSLRIDNVGPEPYGAIVQTVDAAPHRGRTARMSGWLRTRDAASAALTLVVQANGVTLDANAMADKPVKGTTAWQRYTITVPVAANAEFVQIGATMQGKGTLWLDDVELAFQ